MRPLRIQQKNLQLELAVIFTAEAAELRRGKQVFCYHSLDALTFLRISAASAMSLFYTATSYVSTIRVKYILLNPIDLVYRIAVFPERMQNKL